MPPSKWPTLMTRSARRALPYSYDCRPNSLANGILVLGVEQKRRGISRRLLWDIKLNVVWSFQCFAYIVCTPYSGILRKHLIENCALRGHGILATVGCKRISASAKTPRPHHSRIASHFGNNFHSTRVSSSQTALPFAVSVHCCTPPNPFSVTLSPAHRNYDYLQGQSQGLHTGEAQWAHSLDLHLHSNCSRPSRL